MRSGLRPVGHHAGQAPGALAGRWPGQVRCAVNDIKRNFDRPDSPTVATEFVGTSISTNGDAEVYGPYYGPMIKYNPHIKFFDGDRRGYVRCTVTPEEWYTDLRMVTTVSRSDAPAYTFASFVVEDGHPGAQQISLSRCPEGPDRAACPDDGASGIETPTRPG